MKRYKLLKDLPTFKAGDMFYISQHGALIYDDGNFGVMAYARSTLEKFPNILTEWFEEVQELADNVHWKPKSGDTYWVLYSDGEIDRSCWDNDFTDFERYKMGNVYRTKGECKQARNRRLAEIRLRRTSNFKPDFENCESGWAVYYSHLMHTLRCNNTLRYDSGEIVHYETEEDALKSIKENQEDWLIYFGVEEEK